MGRQRTASRRLLGTTPQAVPPHRRPENRSRGPRMNSLPDGWTTKPCPHSNKYMEARDAEGRFWDYVPFPHNQAQSVERRVRLMVRESLNAGAFPVSAKDLLLEKKWDAATTAWALIIMVHGMPVDAGFAKRVKRMVRASPMAGKLDNRVRLLLWAQKQWDPEVTAEILISFALVMREEAKNARR